MKKDTTIPPGYRRVLPYSIVNDLPTAVFFFSAAGQIASYFSFIKTINLNCCRNILTPTSFDRITI